MKNKISFNRRVNPAFIFIILSLLNNIANAQWTDQDPFNRSGRVYDIFFINDSVGWCISENRILHTTNGGNNWSLQLNESDEVLQSIYFVDDNNGWISGKNSTILKTNDAGQNWRTLVNPSVGDLHFVHFVDLSYGWAGGGDRIIRTTDGGDTWNVSDVWPAYVYSLYFSDRDNGWAVGIGDSILTTTDGGVNWRGVFFSNPGNNQMHEVFFNDSLTGWVVGGYGAVLKTTNGGNTWTYKNSGTITAFYDAHFIDETVGWAVGVTSWLEKSYKTTNGGESWIGQNCGTIEDLLSVHFIDLNIGWAGGENGTIIKTNTGGSTWYPEYIGNTIYSISFIDSLRGWAVGSIGNVLFTSNGGIAWQPQISGTSNQLRGVSFCDSNNGWASGLNGTIINTTNGGSNWEAQVSGSSIHELNSIFFTDVNNGWACGDYKILRTTNSGSNWHHYDSDFNHEFKSIFFINTSVGWVVGGVGGTPNSLIKKTTDGGISWTEQTNSGDHWLYSVYFLNENDGWAVGTAGIMLRTTNGGVSWSYQPNITTNSIKAVAFISEDIGWVAGANGIIFHTTDNGQSWSEENSGISFEINSLSFPVFNSRGWAAGGVTIIKNKYNSQLPGIVELSMPINGDNNLQISSIFNWMQSTEADYYRLQVSTDSLFASTVYDNSTITDTFQTVNYLINDVKYFWRVCALNGIGAGGWSDTWWFRTINSSADGWVVQNSGTSRNLRSIFFIDDNTGWTVGDSGIILKTSTSGEIWEAQQSGTNANIHSVHFADSSLGICSIESVTGDILRTTNGGDTWLTVTGGFMENIKDLKFVNNKIAFGVGAEGLIKKTTDGGETWLTGWASWANLNSVDFIDQNYIWASGNLNISGEIIHTSNGGNNFIHQFRTETIYEEYSEINSLESIDQNNIWVCGFGVLSDGSSHGMILKSTNAGADWNVQNSNTNQNLYSIHFINSNLGYVAGTNGTILRTTDSGLTWTFQYCQLSYSLRSIVFTDEFTGWIAGDNGLIMRTINSGLPVELDLFEARIINHGIILSWQTATEVDNYGFEIERASTTLSIDSDVITRRDNEWEKIGFVEGHGNSSSPKSYNFIDRNPVGGSKFLYRLKQIDTDGAFEYSEIVEVELVPMKYELFQNYPNPFNPVTTIKFSLVEKSDVDLNIFNLLGERVISENLNELNTGFHEFNFDGSKLSSGVYFYSIEIGNKFSDVKKMLLLK